MGSTGGRALNEESVRDLRESGEGEDSEGELQLEEGFPTARLVPVDEASFFCLPPLVSHRKRLSIL